MQQIILRYHTYTLAAFESQLIPGGGIRMANWQQEIVNIIEITVER